MFGLTSKTLASQGQVVGDAPMNSSIALPPFRFATGRVLSMYLHTRK